MDMAVLGKQSQVAFEAPEIEKYIARAKKRESVLYALLAGTGLRIGEALAIRISGTDEQLEVPPNNRQEDSARTGSEFYGDTKEYFRRTPP